MESFAKEEIAAVIKFHQKGPVAIMQIFLTRSGVAKKIGLMICSQMAISLRMTKEICGEAQSGTAVRGIPISLRLRLTAFSNAQITSSSNCVD